MEYSYYDHENTFLSGTLFHILNVKLLKDFLLLFYFFFPVNTIWIQQLRLYLIMYLW